MYPPLSMLTRAAAADYPVEGTNLYIPKGCTVVIPVYAIQHDPELYPSPEQFDPDRFSAENMQQRNPYSFLPFGEGPRNCIGLRFGMMQSRIALAKVLLNFKMTLSEKMTLPMTFSKRQWIIASDTGIWLKLEKISN